MMDTVHDNGPKKLELHVGERIFLKLFCLIFRISPWFLEVTEVDSLILILPVKGKFLEYLMEKLGKHTFTGWVQCTSDLKFLGCICTYMCIKRA